MDQLARRRDERERGAALLAAMMILVLVSMLAFAGLEHSEQESTAGARTRATTRTVYAADAGIQLALSRLREAPPNLAAFDVDLADGANVQSRTRTESTPQNLTQAGLGAPAEGYALNVDAGVTSVNRVFLVNVTASAAGSTAELEAKLSRSEVNAGGY